MQEAGPSGPASFFAARAADKTQPADLAEKGAKLYEKYCSICHGSNGDGYLADEANALSVPGGSGADGATGGSGGSSTGPEA